MDFGLQGTTITFPAGVGPAVSIQLPTVSGIRQHGSKRRGKGLFRISSVGFGSPQQHVGGVPGLPNLMDQHNWCCYNAVSGSAILIPALGRSFFNNNVGVFAGFFFGFERGPTWFQPEVEDNDIYAHFGLVSRVVWNFPDIIATFPQITFGPDKPYFIDSQFWASFRKKLEPRNCHLPDVITFTEADYGEVGPFENNSITAGPCCETSEPLTNEFFAKLGEMDLFQIRNNTAKIEVRCLSSA